MCTDTIYDTCTCEKRGKCTRPFAFHTLRTRRVCLEVARSSTSFPSAVEASIIKRHPSEDAPVEDPLHKCSGQRARLLPEVRAPRNAKSGNLQSSPPAVITTADSSCFLQPAQMGQAFCSLQFLTCMCTRMLRLHTISAQHGIINATTFVVTTS